MTIRGTGVRGFAKGKAFVVNSFGSRNPFEGIPQGSILVTTAVSLSDSALIDFKNVIGIVTEEGDSDGQVCVIARGTGIPAITGIKDCTTRIVTGDRILIRNFDVDINPDLQAVTEFDSLRDSAEGQLRLDLQEDDFQLI